MTQQIYRGYEIEAIGNKWVVSLNGKVVASEHSEGAAMGRIDAERRAARQAMEAGR